MRKAVAISIADQALISLFNLGLNAGLIAFADPAEFGHYVYAATIILIATSLQNAIIGTPIAVIYPASPEAEKAAVCQTLLAVDLVFRAAMALLCVPLSWLTDHDPLFVSAAAAALFAGLARETQRNLAVAERRTGDMIRVDAAAIALSIAATLLLWPWLRPSIAALAGLAVGNALAVALAARGARLSSLGLGTLARRYRPIWQRTRWSLVGAATTEVQFRSYVFMLEIFRSARDIATVQAGRLLLGPLPLLVGAWGRVARPELARRWAAGDRRGMISLTLKGLAAILGAGLAFCAVLYLAWPVIERLVFKGRYPDIGLMTATWGLYTLLVIAHMVLSAPLVAALRLKALAQVTMVTAVISVALLAGLALPVPPIYAVAAATVGEAVALVWIIVLVRRLFTGDPITDEPGGVEPILDPVAAP